MILIHEGGPFQEEGKARQIPEVGMCEQLLRKSEEVPVFEAEGESRGAEKMEAEMAEGVAYCRVLASSGSYSE